MEFGVWDVITLAILGAASITGFCLLLWLEFDWCASKSDKEMNVRWVQSFDTDMEIEKRNRELNRKLIRILQEPKKQPELWWGDECVTLREDGKAVLHLRRPTAEEKYRSAQMKRLTWGPVTLKDSLGTDYFNSLSGREIFNRSIDGELFEVRGGYGNHLITVCPNPYGGGASGHSGIGAGAAGMPTSWGTVKTN